MALGVGDAADAQRELRRVAGGGDPQPDRTAPDGLVLQRLDRGRRVAVVGQHQRARGEHVRRAVLRLLEEQVAVERPQCERRALGCGRRSAFDARPRAVGEHDAAQQRVGRLERSRTRRACSAAARQDVGVERRDLDRQAGVRIGLRRQFAVEEPVSPASSLRFSAARRVRTSTRPAPPSSASCRRRPRLGQAGVERGVGEPGEQRRRGRRRARVPRAPVRDRRRPRGSRPPRAAARSSSALTSGSACGGGRQQVARGEGAARSLSARAASRCRRSRCARESSSVIASAIRSCANRRSRAAARRPRARRGPRRARPCGTPATAATT